MNHVWVYFRCDIWSYGKYYNMDVWIWVGNVISFIMAAGLIRLHIYAQCQEISCVTRESVCHQTLNDNHWHRLLEIPAIICVKSNITTFNYVCRFFVNMFYCSRNHFNEFKHVDMKDVRWHITSAASLDDGNCEATIPVVKGHHVT